LNELRDFAPIGMLEYWNDGTMGFGKMGKLNFFNIPLENVVKSMHKKINSFKNQPG
jgi:hypothetical protein